MNFKNSFFGALSILMTFSGLVFGNQASNASAEEAKETISLENIIKNIHDNDLNDISSNQYFDYGLRHGSLNTSSGRDEMLNYLPGFINFDQKDSGSNYIGSSISDCSITNNGKTIVSHHDDRFIIEFTAKEDLSIRTYLAGSTINWQANDTTIDYFVADSYSQKTWPQPGPNITVNVSETADKTTFDKTIDVKKGQHLYWEWGFQWTDDRFWNIGSDGSGYTFEIIPDLYEQKTVNSETYYYIDELQLASNIAGNDLIPNQTCYTSTLATFGFRHGDVSKGNIQKFDTFATNVLGTPSDGEIESTFMQNWRFTSMNGDGAIIYFKAETAVDVKMSRPTLGNDSLAGATLNIYKNDSIVPEYSHDFDGKTDSPDDFSYTISLNKDEYFYWEFINKTANYSVLSMGDDGSQYVTLPVFKAVEIKDQVKQEVSLSDAVDAINASSSNEVTLNSKIGSYSIMTGKVRGSSLANGTKNENYIGKDTAKLTKNSIYVSNNSLVIKVSTNYDLGIHLNFNKDTFAFSDFYIKAYQYVYSIGMTRCLFELKIEDQSDLEQLKDPFILTRRETLYIEFATSNETVTFTNLTGLTFTEKAIGDSLENNYPLYEPTNYQNSVSLTHKEIALESARLKCSPIETKDLDISLLAGTVSEEKGDKASAFSYIQYESGEYLEGNEDEYVLMTGSSSQFDGDNFAAVEDYRIKATKNESTVYRLEAKTNTQLIVSHDATNGGWIDGDGSDGIYFGYYQSNGKKVVELDKKDVISNTNEANAFGYTFNLKAGDIAYVVFGSDVAYQRNLNIAFKFQSTSENYNSEDREQYFADAKSSVYMYDVISDTIKNDCQPVSYDEALEIELCHGTVDNHSLFETKNCTGDGSGSSSDALFAGSTASYKAFFQRWQMQAGKSNDNAITIFKALKNIHLTITHPATEDYWATFSSFRYYIADTDNFLDYKEERFVSSDLPDDYFGYDIYLLAGQSLIISYSSNDDSEFGVVDLMWQAFYDTAFDETKTNDFTSARTLQQKKDECSQIIHNRFAELNEDDYSLSYWAIIEEYVDEFDSDVKDLTTEAEVEELFNECLDGINNALTLEQEEALLVEARENALQEARDYIEKNKDYYFEKTLNSIELRYNALVAQVSLSSSITTIKVKLLSFKSYVDSLRKDKVVLRNALLIGGSALVVCAVVGTIIGFLLSKRNKLKLLEVDRSVTTLEYENNPDYLVLNKAVKKNRFIAYIKRYWPLYVMLVPMVVYLFIFSYIPMGGLTLAFKDFNFRLGIWRSPWASTDGVSDPFKYFRELFENPEWWSSFAITLKISGLRLLVGFFVPVIMTILLTEVKSKRFSKGFQIISYLPHFISWVVIYGILISLTTSGSPVQNLLTKIVGHEVAFFSDPDIFLWLIILTNIWKEAGWSTIIYFAAAAGINPELYEAATIDGASRWKRIMKVTLPGLIPAISINLILQASGFVFGGFEQIFALTGNGVNQVILSYVNITEIFLYKAGITSFQYSLATVVGLFNSVISFVLVLIANGIIKKIGGDGLW